MNIFYLYVSPRKKMEGLWKQRKFPNSLFYGLINLRQRGHVVSYSDISYSPLNPLAWLLLPIQKILIAATGQGFNLAQAIILWPMYHRHDVIIACADSAALPILLLKLLGLIHSPVIYLSIGLVHKLPSSPSWVKTFYGRLFQQADRILVFSEIEADLFLKYFPSVKVSFIPLGIDTKFFSPAKQEDTDFLLTVGRDLDRDYDFLFSFAQKLPLPLIVVTSPRNLVGKDIPANCQVKYDVSYEELRSLYRQAKLILLPLNNNQRASGQLVFLEALAMGKGVVASKVPGITSGYEPLRSAAALVPVNDRQAFVSAVGDLLANSKKRQRLSKLGQKIVQSHYNSQKFGQDLEKIIREVTNDKKQSR